MELAPEEGLNEPESLELVFGLVAPIGVDLDLVSAVLTDTLAEVSYITEADTFRLTKLMTQVAVPKPLAAVAYIESVKERIVYANQVRGHIGDDGLALLAIAAIRRYRGLHSQTVTQQGQRDLFGFEAAPAEEIPLPNQAYVIRQLKRPEEVETLRRVYGKRFVLLSAYSPLEARKLYISEKERKSCGGLVEDVEINARVDALVAMDAIESNNTHGQALRDAFPHGDVFIDASTRKSCEDSLRRFIRLFFGDNGITPSRDEYAMYLAKSVALRSGDLSRQVGAAIFSTSGEVVTLGCNEVPKSGGGTYWPDSEPDGRDYAIGYDPNERYTEELLVDLIDRLKIHGDLAARFPDSATPVDITKELLKDISPDGVGKARILDIIEFGRIIHAEMSAISDAARKGLAVQDGTLFCTTFPCHLCAKHIVAAGIKRVVFLEPYPKSYAWKLHRDSIEVDQRDHPTKVSFEAFIGVSPARYRDLFEKKKRKLDSIVQKWNRGQPQPLIDIYYPAYFQAEVHFIAKLKKMLEAVDRQAAQPAVAPMIATTETKGLDVAPDS
ncbi:MAG TPA: anti-phage dCTP deaminase [Rhizomicrobium sp.]|jgi:cytidine deaminase